ncbi:MAG: aspartyl protease family protein [Weeksellaceae bacterium]|nr:aspartyl protease family protein [Weeksellaceae bacterium]
MKFFYLFIFFLLSSGLCAQELSRSTVQSSRKSFTIPFQLINNLIVMEVEVNSSATLNFILDSGSGYTLITDYTNIDELIIREGKTILLGGLGKGMGVELYDSRNNQLRFGRAMYEDAQILLLMDSKLQLSERMGIPVHGVIGYEILKDFVVEINYVTKRLTFYQPAYFAAIESRKFRRYDVTPFEMHQRKPYVHAQFQLTDKDSLKEKLVLLDSGGWDSFWLFQDFDEDLKIPEPNFIDTLGYGLVGEITGRRARAEIIDVFNRKLERIPGAFPDSLSIQNLTRTPGRKGSIGGELLSRFHLVFDYPNSRVLHRTNRNINRVIYHNLSGITIIKPFHHLPLIQIVNVRENSPAYNAGVRKGDYLDYLNGNFAPDLGVNAIFEKINQRPGKKVTVSLKRDGKVFKTQFRLADPFEADN